MRVCVCAYVCLAPRLFCLCRASVLVHARCLTESLRAGGGGGRGPAAMAGGGMVGGVNSRAQQQVHKRSVSDTSHITAAIRGMKLH